jgi:hypothetical protein
MTDTAAAVSAKKTRLLDAAPELMAALQDLIPRFHSCIRHAGSDEEYADQAVAEYRALIARIEGGET